MEGQTTEVKTGFRRGGQTGPDHRIQHGDHHGELSHTLQRITTEGCGTGAGTYGATTVDDDRMVLVRHTVRIRKGV